MARQIPACPACAAVRGWMIDSPVAAIDRVRIDRSGLKLVGLVKPAEGFEPLGRPVIRCVACGAVAEAPPLRGAILAAATRS